MKQYIEKLARMPIGISGTCLAFITLSNSWSLKGITYLKPVAIFIALSMLTLMVLRFYYFPKVMLSELKHPVTGTFYPTMGMVLWLVSGYFYPKLPVLCSCLWLFAVVYHYAIAAYYTFIRIKEKSFQNIMPTCFIVYTGMITGSVASKGMDGVFPFIPQIAEFMLMFGFVFYTLLLPVVLYIVFRSDNLTEQSFPTAGILCSPAPLGIVGMLTIQESPNPYMLLWLFVTGTLLLGVVYSYVFKLLPKGFKPIYAAFTFPLAISTLAAYKLSVYCGELGMQTLGTAFRFMGDIEIFMTTYVVLFVLFNFLHMFYRAVKPECYGLGRWRRCAECSEC